MTRTLSIAALTLFAATSFTFAINNEGSMRKEIKTTKTALLKSENSTTPRFGTRVVNA